VNAEETSMEVPRRTVMSVAIAAFAQLRPKQWSKNVIFLSPALVFSGEFLVMDSVVKVLIGIAAFSMLASSGYIFNDLLDREADRKHPKKRFRPIASGALPVQIALIEMAVVLAAGCALSWSLGPWFLAVGLIYLVNTLSYSFYFKHLVILDVMFLALGFVWRVIAGALAIQVQVSAWLFLCTAFVALFLGFNKRRAELQKLGDKAGTRKNLSEYSDALLHDLQSVVTSSTIVSYMMYAVMGPTPWMSLTIPFVLYGIFRYIYLVDAKGEGDAPDETVLKDVPIMVTCILYAGIAMGVLYGEHMGWLPDVLMVTPAA
jgi:4-hydroxybenzoate polyprenyltransferase